MKHFIVSETTISDPSWVSAYVKNVEPLVRRFGGEYISRAADVTILEGTGAPPHFYSLLSFPTKEAAEEFYNCDEYKPYKEARQSGADCRMLLVSSEGGEA